MRAQPSAIKIAERLVAIAHAFDHKGLQAYADVLDAILIKMASDGNVPPNLSADARLAAVCDTLKGLGLTQTGKYSFEFRSRILPKVPDASKVPELKLVISLSDSPKEDVDCLLLMSVRSPTKTLDTRILQLKDADFSSLSEILASKGTFSFMEKATANALGFKDRLIATNVSDGGMSNLDRQGFSEHREELVSGDAERISAAYRKILHSMYYQDIDCPKASKLLGRAHAIFEQAPSDEVKVKQAIDLVNQAYMTAHETKYTGANKSSDKQLAAHKFFTDLINLPAGSTVVSPGAGLAHESIVSPNYKWTGLDFQKPLIDSCKERDAILGRQGNEYNRWSILDGDVRDAQQQMRTGELSSRLGVLPKSDAVYLKHACGGITDGALKQAVANGTKKIVVASCCADRFPGISHAILCPEKPFAEYQKLVDRSKVRNSEDGLDAVKEIDDLRQKYLEKNGYKVERGWRTDEDGQRLAAGSYFVATKE